MLMIKFSKELKKRKMKSYNYFANLYDCLTDNVNYQVRSDYISDFFDDNNLSVATVVDLACGTGSISVLLAKKGYNVIGVDLSQEMLSIASQKAFENGCNLTLYNAKMQEFRLPEPVDACVCCLDSINHLTDESDVVETFRCVYNNLKQGGIFIFDVNTVYKHKYVLADKTFVFEDEDYYLVWDNEQIDEFEIRILLDMFIFNGENYDRYSEEFNERAYTVEFLRDNLNSVGFEIIGIYDDLSKSSPSNESERIYFVCKKV